MAYKKDKVWMAKIPDPDKPDKSIFIKLGPCVGPDKLTKTQAKQLEDDVRRGIKEKSEELFDNSEYLDMTVAGLLDYWYENHSKIHHCARSHKNNLYCNKAAKRLLGHINIHKLSAGDIYGFMVERRKESSYRSRQKEGLPEGCLLVDLKYLKHAFKLARDKWEITNNDPFKKVVMPKKYKERVRFMFQPEEEAMMNLVDKKLEENPGFVWFPRMQAIARTAGIRATELCEIEIKGVDVFTKGFYLPDSKNGDPVWIAWNSISEEIVMQILKERPNLKPSDRLFLDDKGRKITRNRISKAQLKLVREAGIEDYRWHDNRHDFFSKMVQNGSTLYEAGQAGGHKDLSSTQRYAHLEQEHKRKAVEKVVIRRYKTATIRKMA